jgi:hypothetical protein
MNSKIDRLSIFIVLIVIFLMMTNTIIPSGSASIGGIQTEGYTKGVSYKPVVPLKKTTFVGYDENSYLDDYAYLASVPTAVFNDGNQLLSSPLLFYQHQIKNFDKKKETLNAYPGINYFMEDWISFCDYQLDQIIGINVERDKLKEWEASEYIIIEGSDPYNLASQIASYDWSYSDNAVIATIEEDFEKPNNKLSNTIQGAIQKENVYELSAFEIQQSNSLNPVYHEFNVESKYKYIKAEAWWDGIIFFGGVMVPTGDPDLQLYCKKEGKWMQTAAVAQWNVYSPIGHEYTYGHVYNPGAWRIGITDYPTEGDAPRKSRLGGLITIQGSLLKALGRTVNYNVDVTLFPGEEINILDNPPFGCRNAYFKLTWEDENICLGFSLIGPSGEVISTSVNESNFDFQEMYVHQLGECLPGENYSISVFTLNDITTPIDFEIEYEWEQQFSEIEGNALTSATEGAVLASIINAPLLYMKPDDLLKITEETLLQLGVKNVYLMDIGNKLTSQSIAKIENNFKIKEHFINLPQVFNHIHSITKSNDVIFSTIDPWTYWYVKELKPGGETEAALFLGPAAYLAAHHGSPVLIVDMHPQLSSAVVWHNQFWRNFVAERYKYIPSVADMVLTGRKVYNFLRENEFDKTGRETIITVAGQYDIGIPWDRVFVGEAKTGRIWGTPIDTSYWIARSVFYPGLIFINPAVESGNSITLINGSISERNGFRGLLRKPFLNTLDIKRESGDEKFKYPVMCSFVTHKYRFNERASKYYGSKYQCADGLIPGETTTMEHIDQGVNKKHYGVDGAYFPDISESEIIPFYLKKGGFDTVFSTELESVMDNLNKGVILWIHSSHGLQNDGGITLFWDPEEGFKNHRLIKPFAGAIKEENPWRGYDWELGSTEEPDTMSMDIRGYKPFRNRPSLFLPATGMDWVLARKPVKEKINDFLDFIRIIPFRLKTEDLYDGLTGTISFSKYPLVKKNATQMENQLDNLHSVGFITSICQTSNTYLHLMMIRHGSVFQVQDPWPTSWYGAVWRQSIPRDIILGDTVGEAYVKGMSHVGILYLGDNGGPPQWWWDSAENVVYFGDPDLRMYVPSTKFSDANNWERPKTLRYDPDIKINGHMPFGSTSYPNKIEPKTFLDKIVWVLIAFAIAILFLIFSVVLKRKQKL